MSGVRHLYVHLPFCAHRCGYCDFVTAVGRRGQHGAYADALLAELELERERLAPGLETVFLGGGTPTLPAPAAPVAIRWFRECGVGETADRPAVSPSRSRPAARCGRARAEKSRCRTSRAGPG